MPNVVKHAGVRIRNKVPAAAVEVVSMPLLREEPQIHPEELFSLPAGESVWGVVHVRSRQEKVLARFLLQRDIAFYLPLLERKRTRAGRSLRSFVPLFPGYVFFRAPLPVRGLIWRSNVAASLLEVPDQESFGAELEQIRRLQLAGASFEVQPEILPGDPVQILEGAFRGYKGTVIRDKGRDRLVVRISLLRQAVAAEFDRDVLRPSR